MSAARSFRGKRSRLSGAPPIQSSPPGCPLTRVRARRMCCRNASSVCCWRACRRHAFFASLTPRRPRPIWRRAFSTFSPNGRCSTTPRSTPRSKALRTAARPRERDFARRLFARTVETPGGLKVQTIHAFCERILHLFPLKANVPAGFRIIDDIERGALLANARKETLDRALNEDDRLRDALATVARDASEATFDGLIGELLHHRGALRGVVRGEEYERDLRRRLGLAEGETLADIEARMIDGGIASKDWPTLVERLRQGGKRDAGTRRPAYASGETRARSRLHR